MKARRAAVHLDRTHSYHHIEHHDLQLLGGVSGAQRKIPQQQNLTFSAVKSREMCGRKVQGAGKVDVVEPESFPFCLAAESFSLDFGERTGMRWKGIRVARS